MGDMSAMESPDEAEAANNPQEEGSESEGTTATIDAAILKGQSVSPGDRIELEVVSTDPDTGSVTVKYPEETPAETPATIEGAASKFDEQSS